MEDNSINVVNTTATKRELTPSYYPLWASEMDLMLTSKGLDDHIYEENVKMITENSPDYKKGHCKKVRGSTKYYYAEEVTDEMIKNDNKTKFLISTNLDDKTKSTIDFKNKTAYEVWNHLQGLFLEELGESISDERKFNYLYNALPSDIVQLINVISYQDDWKKCCEQLKKTIPRLKYLRSLKSDQEKIKVYNSEINNQQNNKRKVICFKCGKAGHIARDCRVKTLRRRQNSYKRYNNYKRKYENKDQRKKKEKYHADNVKVNLDKEERENYNEIFDNALSIDYNDDNINQLNSAISDNKKFR
ncbi:hypothetical protein LY90DRAFT_517136 [Neocallimastix californiae]|uniref:CCHC-type domain-containing protein n=1 Tax=Neocallimastix californiae TaxID=1754190 RepID=A0A1Y2ABT7_9FUNG|nr:hypothetical protein LY90DRAFT_517136 [Neocallimastix californiae]|eukprot:ORY20023.1 hypothetical protein LY90DRAFT_517136 [Neocallimastix californiae]